MEMKKALIAFTALSKETRLKVFRLLIRAGPEGMLAGEIGRRLGVRQNTMSANLTILLNSGLVRNEREGKSVRYFADIEGIRGLLGYLMEDCCGGNAEVCQPVIEEISCSY